MFVPHIKSITSKDWEPNLFDYFYGAFLVILEVESPSGHTL